LRRTWHYLSRTGFGRFLEAYFDSSVSDYASGLAFNAFVAMFPLMLAGLALLGYLIQDKATLQGVQNVLLATLPAESQSEVLRTLTSVEKNRASLGVVAVVGLLWSGTNFFAAMEFALNRIYRAKARGFFRQRLLGVEMMAVFAVAVAVTVAVNTALPALGLVTGWLTMTCLLYVVYRRVPNVRIQHREAWPGALLAGLCIEALTLAFPLYYQLTHRSNVFSRGFGLIFLLLTWVYLLSHLLLIGAVLNRLQISGVVPESENASVVPVAENR
jgi:membrane protein